MDDAAIRQSLLEAGWGAEQIDAPALAEPTPHVSSHHVIDAEQLFSAPKKRRWLPIAGITAGAFLVILIAAIGVAEAGYWNGFSRVYRQTALPFLWRGTNANATLSLGKTVLVSADQTKIQSDTTFAMTVAAISPAKKVTLTLHPNTLADIDPATSPVSTDQALQGLPYTFNFSVSTQYDQTKGSQARLDWDLGATYDKLANIRTATPWIPKKIQLEGILLTTQKQGFLRSNILPYKKGDEQKWLRFTLSTQVLGAFLTTRQTAISQKDQDLYKQLAAEAVEDRGIERFDGAAYAHYHLVITPAILQKLSLSQALISYREDLQNAAKQQFSLAAEIYVEPRSARLHHLDVEGSLNEAELNLNLGLKMKETLRYGSSDAIAAPPASLVIPDGPGYMNDILQQLIDSFASGS